MIEIKSFEELKSKFSSEKYVVFRVVGGLGSQLFSISEAFELHKHSGKHVLLDFKSCEFLDSIGNPHSLILTNSYNWCTPIYFKY